MRGAADSVFEVGSSESDESKPACRCRPAFEGGALVVDADDCPGEGALAESRACRAPVVDALGSADAEAVRTRRAGRERAYLDDAAALLVAAGRFADRVAVHDAALADRARRDPIAAARRATGRAGPAGDLVAETGLALLAERFADCGEALRPFVGPTIGHARVRPGPPPDGRLAETRSLSTGATVRRYAVPGDALDRYHVEPAAAALDDADRRTLASARDLLASGAVGDAGAAHEAVRRVADDDAPIERLGTILEKHASDLGVLADCFADPRVSDAFANAPVGAGPLYVRVDGDRCRTNVRLTERGAAALASTLRLRSGEPFSRANPTVDATLTVGDRRVRVAGTTDPVSDGLGFAFRAHERERWTLVRLVRNGTVTPAAAALLSIAVERAAAALIAGTRGAGKTTLLGALLWELSPAVRTLVIEDTPELPVEALQEAGRDVQGLVTARGDGAGVDAPEALRTALRLGEGALVVGEVRGEEAAVLYEAMRVGASGSAVLGTIHGDGAASVRERVVSDLGVPESSFAATDLVVTMERCDAGEEGGRRLAAVEEAIPGDDGVRFAPLFEVEGNRLVPTGRIRRGTSRLVESLATPEESYADLLSTLAERSESYRREAGTQSGGDPTSEGAWPTTLDARSRAAPTAGVDGSSVAGSASRDGDADP